jgi:hypothetical protein
MSALPPDPPRLRAILAYLDKQLAENETVGIYLRLQRQAVLAALEHAERPPRQQRPARKVKGGGPLPGFAPPPVNTGYVVQQKRTPHGHEPAVIHLADCTVIEGTPTGSGQTKRARRSLTRPSNRASSAGRTPSWASTWRERPRAARTEGRT